MRPLLAPTGDRASGALGGLVLLAAGLYQLTPLKHACLAQCQSPLFFIQRHGGFRADAPGSFRLGLTHGAYCVGCCWALMALLFVGVTNVLWIFGLTALVLLEELAPPGGSCRSWSDTRCARPAHGSSPRRTLFRFLGE